MKSFYTALLTDIATFSSQKTFLPKEIQFFLEKASLIEVQSGITGLLQLSLGVIHSESTSPLAKEISHFLATDVAEILDGAPIPSTWKDTSLQTWIENIQTFSKRSREAICVKMCQELSPDEHEIVITSPITLSIEEKKQLRQDIHKKYGPSYIQWRVQKNLLGGLTVYIDGMVYNYSIQEKVQHIFSQLYLNVT